LFYPLHIFTAQGKNPSLLPHQARGVHATGAEHGTQQAQYMNTIPCVTGIREKKEGHQAILFF
jgi:hypothetical protein